MNYNEIRTISDLIDVTTEEMVRLDYKPSVLKQFHVVWKKLRIYAGEKDVCEFSVQFGIDFLENVLKIYSNPLTAATTARWLKAINLLSDFKRTGIITLRKPKREFLFAEVVRVPFQQIITHKIAIGLSEAHIRDTSMYLERFSNYLMHAGLQDISELNSEHILAFVNSLAVYELPTIYHTLCVLRTSLKYLYEHATLENDLSSYIPNVKYSKRAKIPSAYSREEVETMISSIDRANPRGKRDYVIILLAARLGLRASDIANLTFLSFQWEKNTIEIIQHKTNEVITLPILNDIGEAVIDYIRYARPQSESKYIFLKLNAPNDVMLANTIHHIVYSRLLAAGINIPKGKKHGPHALRHSLAGALLEQNVPMQVISEALGHCDTDTTSIYLKIDIKKLKACALDVPDFCLIFRRKRSV